MATAARDVVAQQGEPVSLVAGSEEERLWTEYAVALARKQSCWQLTHELWRKYVLTGLRDNAQGRAYHESIALHEQWRDRADAAYAAWKQVAYPANGLSLD